MTKDKITMIKGKPFIYDRCDCGSLQYFPIDEKNRICDRCKIQQKLKNKKSKKTRYNNLTIIGTKIKTINGKKIKYLNCRCDCGNNEWIEAKTVEENKIRYCSKCYNIIHNIKGFSDIKENIKIDDTVMTTDDINFVLNGIPFYCCIAPNNERMILTHQMMLNWKE